VSLSKSLNLSAPVSLSGKWEMIEYHLTELLRGLGAHVSIAGSLAVGTQDVLSKDAVIR
jgi:hypothetical protein